MKTGRGHCRHTENFKRMEKEDNEAITPSKKGKKTRRGSTTIQRTCNMARKIWVQMGLPFLFEKRSGRYVARHGVAMR